MLPSVDHHALTANDTITQTFTFALNHGFLVNTSDSNVHETFYLKPYDLVVVRKSPAYEEQESVTVEGAVNFRGLFAMSSKSYRLSDLIKDAGGLAAEAYPKGARLERAMTAEERYQREAYLREQQITLYEESLIDPNYNIQRADSLLDMKIDLGLRYTVAIDLEAAIKKPGSEDDIELRNGDRLIVPQYSSTVKISGDVMRPISVTYKKGETLAYYVQHAGGYGDNARKRKVYAVYQNGAVVKINRHSRKAIQPGCEIVVPTKKLKKNSLTTAETLAIGTSAASIGTMVITVANILK